MENAKLDLIIYIKHLGSKQHDEVAAGLHHNGLVLTEWDLFYQE